MKRRLFWLYETSSIIIIVITISVFSAYAGPFEVPEGHMLPTSLAQACRNNGFEEMSYSEWWAAGNIDRPPAFITGFLSGAPEDSVAFWCEKREGEEVKYYLVFHMKDKNPQISSCPKVIEWNKNPRGLFIYGERTYSGHGRFEDLLQPSRSIPEEFLFNDPIIGDGYDGFYDFFYCVEGRWIVGHDYDW